MGKNSTHLLHFDEFQFSERISVLNQSLNQLNSVIDLIKQTDIEKAIPNIRVLCYIVQTHRLKNAYTNHGYLRTVIFSALEKKYLENGLELSNELLNKHIERYKKLYDSVATLYKASETKDIKYIHFDEDNKRYYINSNAERYIKISCSIIVTKDDKLDLYLQTAENINKLLEMTDAKPNELLFKLFDLRDGKFVINHRYFLS